MRRKRSGSLEMRPLFVLSAVSLVIGLVACSGKVPDVAEVETKTDPRNNQVPRFEVNSPTLNTKELALDNPKKTEDPVFRKVEEADHNDSLDFVSDKPFKAMGTYATLGGAPSGGPSKYGRGGGNNENPNSTESYDRIVENEFHLAIKDPLSTFSIDVDTASYSNVRRFLGRRQLPPKGAVRVEELINYFTYDYPQPEEGKPFSVTTEVAGCPWDSSHQLVHIGIQGRRIPIENVPPRNLVFLLDVSGSMRNSDKLPLLKSAMSLLVENLREEDRVAMVVYAGASGLVLPSTSGAEGNEILSAIERLNAGGSTNGGAGIRLAYQVAQQNFIQGGINRVILATDGDFNVGTTSRSELVRLIEKKREGGVFLTVLGFGRGNYKDATMEKLADKGNGNYAYIDSLKEARKVLVTEVGATLVTIAKDVKIQVEFNPAHVQAYRLVGYENRMLKARDFNDDKKDAGEIGAGHSVTAIYEVIPPGEEWTGVDDLKYQEITEMTPAAASDELLTLKLRFKQPDGEKSSKLVFPVKTTVASFGGTSDNFRFSSAVAAFGMLLRDSSKGGTLTLEGVHEIARTSLGEDSEGYRKEFLGMIQAARKLKEAGKTR